MVTQEAIRTNNETQRPVYIDAYDRIGVPDEASLSEVVQAIGTHRAYQEASRRFFSATSDRDRYQDNLLYKVSIIHSMDGEMDRCVSSDPKDKEAVVAALNTFLEAVDSTHGLSVEEALLREINDGLFETALDVISNPQASMLEKYAISTLSLRFAASQLGAKAKSEMIVSRRIECEQAVKLTHINAKARAQAHENLAAIKGFFELAQLDYEVQYTDSRLVANTQRALESVQNQIENGRQALSTGAQLGRRAAAVAVLAGMGTTAGASLAAADTNMGVESSSPSGSDSVVVMSAIGNAPHAVVATPIAAVVSGEANDIAMAQINAQPAAMEILPVTVIESSASEVVMAAITTGVAPEKELGTITVATTEIEDPAQIPTVAIGGYHEGDGHDHSHGEEEAASAVPTAVQSTEPQANEDGEVVSPEPVSLTAPNSDVNVAVGETPQEAITRIVASRDMKAASFAIRQNYAGVDAVHQPAVNEALKNLIAEDTEILKAEIPAAAHADPAYTEKAFTALAYLDAIVQTPSLLDNPEIAAFVASIADQGEDYRNKLFATYVAEAKAELASEQAGAYANIAEHYRPAIENLYAYVAMAAASDEVQTQQIQAIKDEEARIAAEEEAKRIAAEQAAAGLSEIEAVAADEKRLALTAIDRAEQQGLITPKYAAVYRLVIDQEGPGAIVAAAGMIGNCMAEADGCNPVIVERGNGIGFGIFQWSFGRRGTLEATAAAQGVDVGDIGFQVRYAIAESKNRTMRDSTGNEWAGIMSQSDPAAAAEFWRWNFERPRDHLSSTNTRIRVAQEVFAHVTGQMDTIRAEAEAARVERERVAAERAAEEERLRQLAMSDPTTEAGARALCEANGIPFYGAVEGYENGEKRTVYVCEMPERARYYPNQPVYVNATIAVQIWTILHEAWARGDDLKIVDDYRTIDQQADLRVKNGCPDIWTSPSSTCETMTAKPGWSNHQAGEAVDFADVGGYRSARFNLIKTIVEEKGLKLHNLRGEAWHWSIDGN